MLRLPGIISSNQGPVLHEKVCGPRLPAKDGRKVKVDIYSEVVAVKVFEGNRKIEQVTLELGDCRGGQGTKQLEGRLDPQLLPVARQALAEVLEIYRLSPPPESIEQPNDYDRNGIMRPQHQPALAKAISQTKRKLRWAIRDGDLQAEKVSRQKLHDQRLRVREAEAEILTHGGLVNDRLLELFPGNEPPAPSETQISMRFESQRSSNLEELRRKLEAMDDVLLTKVLKGSTLKLTGSNEEKIDRVLKARECIDTLKSFVSQQEVFEAIRQGEVDPCQMFEWAKAIGHKRSVNGLGSHNSCLVLSILAEWGHKSGAFTLPYGSPGAEEGEAPFYPRQAVKQVAGEIQAIKPTDVYRILDRHFDHADELACYIASRRPDLKDEVVTVMTELTGWDPKQVGPSAITQPEKGIRIRAR